MELISPVLVVSDMERSLRFYREVLGLEVTLDFGANKTLTGGLSLQTMESYQEFIGRDDVALGSHSFEVYFEEEEFDAFVARLEGMQVDYVHPVKEHAWGQRVVRLYDPDRHIVEVGEAMGSVCRRFLESGMRPEQVAQRMDVPVDYVLTMSK